MSERMQGGHIGPDLNKCWDEDQLLAHSYKLGDVVWGENGKAFRFVHFKDAVTYVKGHVVCLQDNDANEWDVTNDISAAMAGDHPVGVVFQDTVPTENQYGFVQICGVADILAGSASIVAGDWLKPDASTDGAMDEATAGTDENICAIALATIADTETGKAQLYNLF